MRKRLSLICAWAAMLAAGWLAWRWRDATGPALWFSDLVAVLFVVNLVLVVLATVRDMWTEDLCGSPEAPECPDWATPRQRTTWVLLHSIDALAPAAPKAAIRRPVRRPPAGHR